ncbi:hypothetical protein AXF42_Ash000981 [Apostasia shenzhenica]|uniref:Uncharacterized protein n=1 Tax=Apostasia shenzhenica TaxID=1088818 RepID=A0A2I0ATL7_9ASPA|nr:hypothetical protein AXF42_Ash000981 [Apostasia shenzhenica]
MDVDPGTRYLFFFTVVLSFPLLDLGFASKKARISCFSLFLALFAVLIHSFVKMFCVLVALVCFSF